MDSSKSHEYTKLLIKHILGGNAFIEIEEILNKINHTQAGIEIAGLPYSFWQIFEHMRIAQKDILDFSVGIDYKILKWPDEYWPENSAPDSIEHWENTKVDFLEDRNRFNKLLESNPKNLLIPFEHGDGQNLLREALLVIEHNAYHTGQLMIISRLLNG
ncbi:MAG TPA: DinB family protein [Anditalea sp.]|nr:DinB family protein [Anditalea sp.]